MIVDQAINLKESLQEYFGHHQFRGNQERIIQNLLDKKNTFVIMPTGAGKSLCYQLPALVQPGTAIVISPLIALMKNQVDQMNAFNINAQFLNSTLNKTETNRVKKGHAQRQYQTALRSARVTNQGRQPGFLKRSQHLLCCRRRGALYLRVGPRLPPRVPPHQVYY